MIAPPEAGRGGRKKLALPLVGGKGPMAPLFGGGIVRLGSTAGEADPSIAMTNSYDRYHPSNRTTLLREFLVLLLFLLTKFFGFLCQLEWSLRN